MSLQPKKSSPSIDGELNMFVFFGAITRAILHARANHFAL
jgi:hypothetical protein